MQDNEKIIGEVTWFSNEKGYGFIHSNAKSYFVHHGSILGKGFKSLRANQRVVFKPSEGLRGPVANEVEIKGDLS